MTVVEFLILACLVASVVGLLRRGTPDGAWLLGISLAVLLILLLMFGDAVSSHLRP